MKHLFSIPVVAILFLSVVDVVYAKKHKRTWDYPLFYYQRDEIEGSTGYLDFTFDLREDPDVAKEFRNNDETGNIGYLLYEQGKVVVDQSDIPQVWEGNLIHNDVLPSHSMGKSLVSYVTGHAICEG